MTYQTIPELLERSAALHPDRRWLWFGSDVWTLAEVAAETDRFAAGLAERGVTAGDRVALLLGNQPGTLFGWFGANRLGAIAAPFNPALKPPELAALFRLTSPRVVIADEHRSLVEAAGAISPAPPCIASADLARAGAGSPRAIVRPDDAAILIATSGTTGAAKAVVHSHQSYALTAEAFPHWLGLSEADRLYTALPLSHINAQAYSTLGSLAAGAGLALGAAFSASRFWAELKRLGATQFNAVGAMLHILLKRDPDPAERDHAVRLCYAALALPEAQHRAFEQRFGVALTVGYGLSETPFGTIWPRGESPYETMGPLRQHPRLGAINHARVVGPDGSDAQPGEVGELWLQNPALMLGYWAAPEATREVLHDGWLATGDLVRRDARGVFTFVSRKKDVIRRRGENIGAAEIESVLLSHPAIAEAAAVGIPSDLGEEDIVAYVAGRPGADIDIDELTTFCRAHLADFKVPSVFHVRDALPRTPTERIAKHLLK